ncbi:hypothetical protein LZ31DRAFT_235108 [Colletotrichum somersetense]|nr:hypothetical protein LZ31DRAFT_235108 [Colletotrichum somersetense]
MYRQRRIGQDRTTRNEREREERRREVDTRNITQHNTDQDDGYLLALSSNNRPRRDPKRVRPRSFTSTFAASTRIPIPITVLIPIYHPQLTEGRNQRDRARARQSHNLPKAVGRKGSATYTDRTRQTNLPRALFFFPHARVQRSAQSVLHPEARPLICLFPSPFAYLFRSLPAPLSLARAFRISRARHSRARPLCRLQTVPSCSSTSTSKTLLLHSPVRLSPPFSKHAVCRGAAGWFKHVKAAKSSKEAKQQSGRHNKRAINQSVPAVNHLGGVKHVDSIRQIKQFRRVPTRRALSSTQYDTEQRDGTSQRLASSIHSLTWVSLSHPSSHLTSPPSPT